MANTISLPRVNDLLNCAIECECSDLFNESKIEVMLLLTESAACDIERLMHDYDSNEEYYREGDWRGHRRAEVCKDYLRIYLNEMLYGQRDFIPQITACFADEILRLEEENYTFEYCQYGNCFGYFDYEGAPISRNISLAESTQLDPYEEPYYEESHEGNEDWYCEGSGQYYEDRMEVECYGWCGDCGWD